MVRTHDIDHARLRARADNFRLVLVTRGVLQAESAWYFEYPVVCKNTYSRPEPTSLPLPLSLVFVPLIDRVPQMDTILLQACIHSCQYDCPRCRVSGPQFPIYRTMPLIVRRMCVLWNHLPQLNGVDGYSTCPAPPDPTTGNFDDVGCLYWRD